MRGAGIAFTALEEPNPHDTYFALATLELVHADRRDEGTIRYLQAIQQPDGGYASLAQAFLCCRACTSWKAGHFSTLRPALTA